MKQKDMTVQQFISELFETMDKFVDKAEGKIKDLQEKNSELEQELNHYKLTYDGSFERLFQATEDKLVLQARVEELEGTIAGLVGNIDGTQEEYVRFIEAASSRHRALVESLEKSEAKRRSLVEDNEQIHAQAVYTINKLENEIHQLQLNLQKHLGETNDTMKAWGQDQDAWDKRVIELEGIIDGLLDNAYEEENIKVQNQDFWIRKIIGLEDNKLVEDYGDRKNNQGTDDSYQNGR